MGTHEQLPVLGYMALEGLECFGRRRHECGVLEGIEKVKYIAGVGPLCPEAIQES